MRKLLIIFILTSLSACVQAPVKDFKARLFVFDDAPCLYYGNGEEVFEICPDDEGYLKAPVVMDISDYIKELAYQDLLIKECKAWR